MLNRLALATRASRRMLVIAAAVVAVNGTSIAQTGKEANPVVVMETTKGTITLELYPDKAPVTVENFLWYVDNGFFNGLIFHRVMTAFMIQGGGFTKDMVQKQPRPAIKNEAKNGLKNDRGTVAMARTTEINSATCQFFINLKDNGFLNYTGDDPKRYGYAVFAKVTDGMAVVDDIATVKVVDRDGHQNVPATPVVINKAYRAQAAKKQETTAPAKE